MFLDPIVGSEPIQMLASLSETSDASLSQLDTWRKEAPDLLSDHAAEYRALLAKVPPLIAAGRLHEAAAAAQLAADHAGLWHNGRFSCPELEKLISQIGEAGLARPGVPRAAPEGGRALEILHVATEVYAIGGHSRMARQWIREDARNRHSLALTRQHVAVPEAMAEAVHASGGTIEQLNQKRGDLLDWAGHLQSLMERADVVILHVHSMDIIAFLACAGMKRRPPVLFVNHTDHLFWVGASFADVVICTRSSGLHLCVNRRGIPPERLALLPLCLDESGWQADRVAAREKLGLAPSDIMILTVARGAKFAPVGTEEFPDPLVGLLRNNPAVHLVAVGPGGEVDWSRAENATGGRVRTVHATPDTAPYFAAADIYLDSFPFVSITSLLEAARSGLPLVTRNPFGPDCAVMGADTIGLDASILRAESAPGLVAVLQSLIDDKVLRRRHGDAARAETLGLNFGNGWRSKLDALYQRSLSAPRSPDHELGDLGAISDLDRFVHFVYGDQRRGATAASRLSAAAESVIKAGPLAWRLRTLLELRRAGVAFSATQAAKWCIPEWLSGRIRAYLRKAEAKA